MERVAVIMFTEGDLGGWGRSGLGREGKGGVRGGVRPGRAVIPSCRAAMALHLDVIEEQRWDALDNGLQERTSALAGRGALL